MPRIGNGLSLKLLLYSHYWLPIQGGVQTVVTTLAEGLATSPSAGAEVTLVTQTARCEMDDTAKPFRIVRRPGVLKLLSMIWATDVLHVANPAFLPMLLAWLLRKPTVVEHDGYQTVCPNGLLLYGEDRSVCPGHFMARDYSKCVRCNTKELGLLGSLRLLALTFPRRWLARRVIRNIAPTRHVGSRISLPNTEIVYHGVPDRKAAGDAPPASPDGKPIAFAYVGRLVLEKGVAVLLRAAGLLRKRQLLFRLLIIGDGPVRNELREMASRLDLDSCVEFLGLASAEAIPALLSSVAAIVIPSVWEDVAPLVAAEQLMLGSLIIASDIGGLGEIVNGWGLKFPAGDAEALASCMENVITDYEALRELRKRARARAMQMHTEERMLEGHARLYRSLAETSDSAESAANSGDR